MIVETLNTLFANLPADQLDNVVTVLVAMVPITGGVPAQHRGDLASLLRFARGTMQAPGGRHVVRRLVAVLLQYSAQVKP